MDVGNGSCVSSEVQVQQYKIRDIPPGDSEYIVKVINPGACLQSDIVLACNDFNSLEPLDTSIVDVDGEHIYIKKNISDYSFVSFKYSWPHEEIITPLSSNKCC